MRGGVHTYIYIYLYICVLYVSQAEPIQSKQMHTRVSDVFFFQVGADAWIIVFFSAHTDPRSAKVWAE